MKFRFAPQPLLHLQHNVLECEACVWNPTTNRIEHCLRYEAMKAIAAADERRVAFEFLALVPAYLVYFAYQIGEIFRWWG